jgi:hypothetical protein
MSTWCDQQADAQGLVLLVDHISRVALRESTAEMLLAFTAFVTEPIKL